MYFHSIITIPLKPVEIEEVQFKKYIQISEDPLFYDLKYALCHNNSFHIVRNTG